MMDTKYDLQPDQTPYPYSWFSSDIKLGCLSIHLDEDNWSKCTVSEMQTNIQLMISMHLMDQGSLINYDIEEKQINLGVNLMIQELLNYIDDINKCERQAVAEDLLGNHKDFKMLYSKHYDEIQQAINQLSQNNKDRSSNLDNYMDEASNKKGFNQLSADKK